MAFVTENKSVYNAVRTDSLNKAVALRHERVNNKYYLTPIKKMRNWVLIEVWC
jgi:hypothetical protein